MNDAVAARRFRCRSEGRPVILCEMLFNLFAFRDRFPDYVVGVTGLQYIVEVLGGMRISWISQPRYKHSGET